MISAIGNLAIRDIRIETTHKGEMIALITRQSKKDQAGKGVSRSLLESGGPISPVRTLEQIMATATVRDFG